MTAQRGLAEIFRRLIATTGPISLAHYMAEANARYYAKADPLGAGGDLVTAPEISQMFGELVGLWLADLWIRAGREFLTGCWRSTKKSAAGFSAGMRLRRSSPAARPRFHGSMARRG